MKDVGMEVIKSDKKKETEKVYLKASFTHDAEIKAFVDAMAGIMFFTTCIVRLNVTPDIPNLFARSNA